MGSPSTSYSTSFFKSRRSLSLAAFRQAAQGSNKVFTRARAGVSGLANAYFPIPAVSGWGRSGRQIHDLSTLSDCTRYLGTLSSSGTCSRDPRIRKRLGLGSPASLLPEK